ncbi:MAG: hypothetical protein WC188_10370 [Candidatus Caldatribacteriota bacterium]|nr:hypothetical protein [Acholeplasmataceae bacterium]MDD4468600.1 hypothetical protein [Acholeplasmataceae bacterium]
MNEKFKIILTINIVIALLGILVIPSFIREIWDLAILVSVLFGIILIELPICFIILNSNDKKN